MPAIDRLQFLGARSKENSLLYTCPTVYYRVLHVLIPAMVELAPPGMSPDAIGYCFIWT
jgi:hypothetical protein